MASLHRDVPVDAHGQPIGRFAGGYAIRAENHHVLPHTVGEVASKRSFDIYARFKTC